MKISRKFNGFVYFIFLFIINLKMLHFLHFKLIMTLLVTCLINTFWNLLINKFSILKLIFFVISGLFVAINP